MSSAPVAAATSLLLLLVGMLPAVGFFGIARAASTFNAVDYAQCANDKPPSTDVDCAVQGWINGILNTNNSHYAENQVTPQRMTVQFDTAGAHSVQISYMARKGVTHAYDSLATWNHTATGADRCQGLTGTDCPGGSLSTWPIPADGTHIPPSGSGISDVTSAHALSGQEFQMYGGTITGVSGITHDSPASGDDFATLTVSFTTASDNAKVQLLFGGHLALGPGTKGWGAGMGASSISGGEYHIKWTAADTVSIGNRDNQIMAGAVLPPQNTSIATQASRSAATIGAGVTIQDVATVTPSTATGTVTFHLYSDSTCTTPVSNPAFDSTPVTVSGGSATSATWAVNKAGTYYWIADYTSNNPDLFTDAHGACTDANEQITIGKATPNIATDALTSTEAEPLIVGDSIHDTATVTGGFNPTGTVTFTAYSDSSCTQQVFTSTNDLVSGSATSGSYVTTAAGTYYWTALYNGDDNNNTKLEACGGTNESSTVGKAQPSITTVAHTTGDLPDGEIYDVATVSGGHSPTGTVTFQVFGPEATATCDPADEITLTGATVDLVGDTATSPHFTPTKAGNYFWIATYNGDSNNNSAPSACGDANEESSPGKASPSISTRALATATLDAPQLVESPSVQIHDTATLSGATSDVTGTVTFQLFGPETSPTCDPADEINVENPTVDLVNGSATSPDFTVTQPGTYYWVATYNGDSNNNATPPSECGAENESTLVTQPNLDLHKSADPASGSVVQPGQQIDYTVAIPNTGDADVTDATVVDTLPAYVVVDESSISNGGVFAAGTDITVSAGTITWTGVDVPAGGETDLTYSVTVSADVPEGTTLNNLVQLGSLSSTTTHTVASGDLALSKSVVTLAGDNTGSYTAGDPHNTLVYTLTATASGDLVQKDVKVTDYVPGFDPADTTSGKTTYVAGSAECSVACTIDEPTADNGQLITFTVDSMTPPSTVTLTFRVTIDRPTPAADGAIPAETIDNIGFVQSERVAKKPSNKVTTPVTAVLGVKVVRKPPTLPFTGLVIPVRATGLAGLLLITVGAALTATRRRRREH